MEIDEQPEEVKIVSLERVSSPVRDKAAISV